MLRINDIHGSAVIRSTRVQIHRLKSKTSFLSPLHKKRAPHTGCSLFGLPISEPCALCARRFAFEPKDAGSSLTGGSAKNSRRRRVAFRSNKIFFPLAKPKKLCYNNKKSNILPIKMDNEDIKFDI